MLTGSARRPDGDALQFDVPARSANVVLRQLEAFADGRRGSISIESLDAAIGEEATPPPRRRLVQRDIAPIWDIVEAKIRSDAIYAPSFYILLAIAGLIGAAVNSAMDPALSSRAQGARHGIRSARLGGRRRSASATVIHISAVPVVHTCAEG